MKPKLAIPGLVFSFVVAAAAAAYHIREPLIAGMIVVVLAFVAAASVGLAVGVIKE